MAKQTLGDNISEFQEVINDYLKARFDYFRILLIEKVARAGTYFLTTFFLTVIFLFITLFLTFAFSFWYGKNVGSITEAFLISAGFYLVLGIIGYSLRKTLFAGNIVRNISEIVFTDEDETKDETKK